MQRGCGLLWSVLVVFLASVASAQTGVPSSAQDTGTQNKETASELFVGPVLPAPGDGVAQGESVASQQPRADAIEQLPLGQGQSNSFRDQLEAQGHLDAVASTDATPTLHVGEGWWRTAGALIAIILLILALAAVARHLIGRSGGLLHAMGAGGRAPSGLLHVLGRYPVGRGQTLILLKLDRRVMLVCQSVGAKGSGMRTLCEICDPEDVASIVLRAAEAEGRTLGSRFREMVSRFESSHREAESTVFPVEMVASNGQEVASVSDPVGRLHSRLSTLRAQAEEDSP